MGIGVVFVGVIAAIGITALDPVPVTSSTATPPPVLPTTAQTTTGTATPRPTAPTTTRSAAPTTTRPAAPTRTHPADVRYASEGYQSKPISSPVPWRDPQSISQARTWSRNSVLYSKGVDGPIWCPHDPLTANDSPAVVTDRMTKTVDCLMALWEGSMANSGFDLPRPPVYLVDKPFTTACGRVDPQDFAGYYCTASMALFISYPVVTSRRYDGLTTYVNEVTLAHEFGHHIQARAGIMQGSWVLQNQLSGAAALEENRRRELQAQCFAGMAIAAFAHSYGLNDDDFATILKTESGRTGASTHGNSRSMALWWQTAMGAQGAVVRCNTFAAASSDVA